MELRLSKNDLKGWRAERKGEIIKEMRLYEGERNTIVSIQRNICEKTCRYRNKYMQRKR